MILLINALNPESGGSSPRLKLFGVSVDLLPQGLTPSPSKYRHGFGHDIGELKRTETFRRLSALRQIRRHSAQR